MHLCNDECVCICVPMINGCVLVCIMYNSNMCNSNIHVNKSMLIKLSTLNRHLNVQALPQTNIVLLTVQVVYTYCNDRLDPRYEYT